MTGKKTGKFCGIASWFSFPEIVALTSTQGCNLAATTSMSQGLKETEGGVERVGTTTGRRTTRAQCANVGNGPAGVAAQGVDVRKKISAAVGLAEGRYELLDGTYWRRCFFPSNLCGHLSVNRGITTVCTGVRNGGSRQVRDIVDDRWMEHHTCITHAADAFRDHKYQVTGSV